MEIIIVPGGEMNRKLELIKEFRVWDDFYTAEILEREDSDLLKIVIKDKDDNVRMAVHKRKRQYDPFRTVEHSVAELVKAFKMKLTVLDRD